MITLRERTRVTGRSICNWCLSRGILALAVPVGCFVVLLSCVSTAHLLAQETPNRDTEIREIDMRPHCDSEIPLANPHKGWYHHFPDNHLSQYVIANDADLLEFPGMDHLYIRLAWSYVEPREGEFHWEMIDQWIDKWVANGLGVSLRITCRETSSDRIEQQFATPKWVMEAGAKGGFYYDGRETGSEGPWEPVYDDPVFLTKLENFLKAFAARYDGKPWLRYVDIGSFGDWGEGHTYWGSRLEYDFAQRRPHIDLHCKYFKQSQLVVSDDFVHGVTDKAERQRMRRYVLDRGIAYRDDSVLGDYFVKAHRDTFSVRCPELFADTWLQTPQVLELQHYRNSKKNGIWKAPPGATVEQVEQGKVGPDFFRGATGVLHATYIGYHGDAREWLNDNPELTVELLNRCGYWYFLHKIATPTIWKPDSTISLMATWENRGVAPAYEPFQLYVRLCGRETVDLKVDSNNQSWIPLPERRTYEEAYEFSVPKELKQGQYTLKLKLHSAAAGRDVQLALKHDLLDDAGFYTIGKVSVE